MLILHFGHTITHCFAIFDLEFSDFEKFKRKIQLNTHLLVSIQ